MIHNLRGGQAPESFFTRPRAGLITAGKDRANETHRGQAEPYPAGPVHRHLESFPVGGRERGANFHSKRPATRGPVHRRSNPRLCRRAELRLSPEDFDQSAKIGIKGASLRSPSQRSPRRMARGRACPQPQKNHRRTNRRWLKNPDCSEFSLETRGRTPAAARRNREPW